MACPVVVAGPFAKLSRHGVMLITGSLQPPVLGFGITLRPGSDLGWASGQGTQAPAELVTRPVKREQGPLQATAGLQRGHDFEGAAC